MKKLITLCIFMAIIFSGHAQKSTDLIDWLNKEAETINSEKSRSVEVVNGKFTIENDSIKFSGKLDLLFGHHKKEVSASISDFDAILYKRINKSESAVLIFLKKLTEGQRDYIEIHFEKDKSAKKYQEKLIELAKLRNIHLESSMPTYTPTIKEITDHMKRLLEDHFIGSNRWYSSNVESSYDNDWEITAQYIKLSNKRTGMQNTIYWKDLNTDYSYSNHKIKTKKLINGNPEFIHVNCSGFDRSIYTMIQTIEGKPATSELQLNMW
jgi:hypothetical protein